MSRPLAWNILPLPKGTYYTETDLLSLEKVQEVFTGCKAYDAVIIAEGWSFLFHTYTAGTLVEQSRRAGWVDDPSQNAILKNIIYKALQSGYNPVIDEYGTYSPETDEFSTTDQCENTSEYWDNLTVEAFDLRWTKRQNRNDPSR